MAIRVCAFALFALLVASGFAHAKHAKHKKSVPYDARSLIIDGQRELLFSGSVHYPRSTPEVGNS